MSCLEITKEIVSILTSIALVIIGISGLSTWRRQLSGNSEYEQARKVLRIVYELREAVRALRNPFMSRGELVNALKRFEDNSSEFNYTDQKVLERATKYVFITRFETIAVLLSAFSLEAFEAEVLWGKEAQKLLGDLKSTIYELDWAIQVLDARDKKLQEQAKKILYSTDSPLVAETGNSYTDKIKSKVFAVEEFLSPKIASIK